MQQIKLVIKRKKQITGAVMGIDLIVNGYPMATLSNGGSIALDMNPGWHNIVLRMSATGQEKVIYNLFEHDTMIEFYFSGAIISKIEANIYALPPGQY